jgi:hypothetical protein
MYPMSWRGKDAQFFRLSSWDSRASNQDIVGFAKWELLLLADVFQGIHQLYSQICLSYLTVSIAFDIGNGFGMVGIWIRGFAKTTPPGDVLKLPGDPLLWRRSEQRSALRKWWHRHQETSKDIKRQAAKRTSIVFDSQGCFTMFYL